MLLSPEKVETLYDAFGIDVEHREMICFVGAGGKTTTMFKLATELKNLGKRVLVTTSTAIYYPKEEYIDEIVVKEKVSKIDYWQAKQSFIMVIGRTVSKEGKLLGLSVDEIDGIFREGFFDFVLVEGDGSKEKSIKAPADHEPVIPIEVTIVAGVIGLDSVGSIVNEENVHRVKKFCDITKSSLGDIIDESKIVELVLSDKGIFKGGPMKAHKYLLLNKSEGEKRSRSALAIRELLYRSGHKLDGIIISSIINNAILKG